MVDSRWFELWRFPYEDSIDLIRMQKLNEELFTYPGILNIRDNFFVLAKVTDT